MMEQHIFPFLKERFCQETDPVTRRARCTQFLVVFTPLLVQSWEADGASSRARVHATYPTLAIVTNTCQIHWCTSSLGNFILCSSSSWNRGIPKSVPPNHPFSQGFSIINHPFWGTTIFRNPHFLKKYNPHVLFPQPHIHQQSTLHGVHEATCQDYWIC